MPSPVSNPPNPWESTHVEWLGPPPPARLEVYEERAKSALTRNDSPDIPFRFGLNPYRGCQHACAYCYARRTHPYLGLGAGTDFEKRIVVKTNLPQVLRRELARPSWTREPVALSGVTDAYQPLEASYGLTRRILELLVEFETPVVVITKSALVRRDAELLAELHRRAGANVYLSIPLVDERDARLIEPAAPSPARRFEALRALAEAGVPCGVSVSPMVPGLGEPQVPQVLERAREAGATRAFLTLLRLPGEVQQVFRERLERTHPDRAARVFAALHEARAGRPGEARFGERMRGHGPRWESVRAMFELQCRRLGLETDGGELRPALPERRAKAPARPGARTRRARGERNAPGQGELFP